MNGMKATSTFKHKYFPVVAEKADTMAVEIDTMAVAVK